MRTLAAPGTWRPTQVMWVQLVLVSGDDSGRPSRPNDQDAVACINSVVLAEVPTGFDEPLDPMRREFNLASAVIDDALEVGFGARKKDHDGLLTHLPRDRGHLQREQVSRPDGVAL